MYFLPYTDQVSFLGQEWKYKTSSNKDPTELIWKNKQTKGATINNRTTTLEWAAVEATRGNSFYFFYELLFNSDKNSFVFVFLFQKLQQLQINTLELSIKQNKLISVART